LASAIISDSEVEELQSKLGVRFSNRDLLLQALTHESFVNEWGAGRDVSELQSYERLEYLGDAVLNFTVANALFESSDDATEGEMSMGRAHVVCKDSLASAAERIDLGNYILRGKGEAIDSPNVRDSVLEDAFEAIIGALYVDQGNDAARKFVFHHLGEQIEHVVQHGVDKDPKSAFQELVQGVGLRTPRYRTQAAGFNADGQQQYRAQVLIGGREVASGFGTSKSKSQQNAAKKARKRFADGVPTEFMKLKTKRSNSSDGLSEREVASVWRSATNTLRRTRTWLSLNVLRKSEETPGRHLIYKRPD
jgi:ribonuclease-3